MTPPSYENMSNSELEAFLAEMEPDIRAADRDLREIEILEKKEVTSAGKLPEYQTLQPRLDALMKAHEEDLHKAAELEQRIARLMDRYATNVRVNISSIVSEHAISAILRWTHCRSYSFHGMIPCEMLRSRSPSWKETTTRINDLDTHDDTPIICMQYIPHHSNVATPLNVVFRAVLYKLRVIFVARERWQRAQLFFPALAIVFTAAFPLFV